MLDTHFVNVTGLDPGMGSENVNYATALDIAALLEYIFENRQDIFTILTKTEHVVHEISRERLVPIQTTNMLLLNQETPLPIVGGKTGTTPKAKSNLANIVNSPSEEGYITTVILGSEDASIDTAAIAAIHTGRIYVAHNSRRSTDTQSMVRKFIEYSVNQRIGYYTRYGTGAIPKTQTTDICGYCRPAADSFCVGESGYR